MNEKPLRWGILGAANIARKNWRAIQLSGNGRIVAVASRDLERAQRFVAENQAVAPFATVPHALASYEELLASNEIDAVYLPLPTGLRKEWVLRAAAAGKHIVCEKPCGIHSADLREMLEVCRLHRVQFMDGVMFMHGARLARMRELLDEGTTVGELRRVTSAFSFRGPDNFFETDVRSHSGLEPLGCLGDLGWYCVRLSLWAYGWQLPLTVSGRVLSQRGRRDSPEPVPTEFSGELIFEGGRSASYFCSFTNKLHQWAQFDGTRGSIRLDDFVIPKTGDETVYHANGQRHSVSEHGSGHATAQETNLFRNFARQVCSGTLNPGWPEQALKTQQVVDACRASAIADGRAMRLA